MGIKKKEEGQKIPPNFLNLFRSRNNAEICIPNLKKIFKKIASSDPSDKDENTVSAKDLVMNIWRPGVATDKCKKLKEPKEQEACIETNKWFFLKKNPQKAQKCIEEFDKDGDKKWNMDEWLAFEELIRAKEKGQKIPPNFLKLFKSRNNAKSCIPTLMDIFEEIASSDPDDADKSTISATEMMKQFWRPKEEGEKWYYLPIAKAEKCIEEYDKDGDKKWNMDEWKVFNEMVNVGIVRKDGKRILPNVVKLFRTRDEVENCIKNPILPRPKPRPPKVKPTEPNVKPTGPKPPGPTKKITVSTSEGHTSVKIDIDIELELSRSFQEPN